MTARRCFREHMTQGICSAEMFVLFHNTQFRVALVAHEFSCEKCKKKRRIYFIS